MQMLLVIFAEGNRVSIKLPNILIVRANVFWSRFNLARYQLEIYDMRQCMNLALSPFINKLQVPCIAERLHGNAQNYEIHDSSIVDDSNIFKKSQESLRLLSTVDGN